jgi:release factor glutamine methyltransferase
MMICRNAFRMTYAGFLKALTAALAPIYPGREIESIGRLVLEHLTELSWVQIRLGQDSLLTPDQESRVAEIITRLQKHEPVQYILGETEFYGLNIRVGPGVLIPRGETEELVDWILKSRGMNSPPDSRQMPDKSGKTLRILDIGCGSGAIAIALAKSLPGSQVVASDISADALRATRENAILNGVEAEIHTLYLDILSAENTGHPVERPDITAPQYLSSFDIIVSNPPYVPVGEMTEMDRHVVEYEPERALFVPDDDPLLFYRAIARFASANLEPGGQVFVEIHDRLGEETADLFRKWFPIVELRKDIHGKDRMIRAHHG